MEIIGDGSARTFCSTSASRRTATPVSCRSMSPRADTNAGISFLVRALRIGLLHRRHLLGTAAICPTPSSSDLDTLLAEPTTPPHGHPIRLLRSSFPKPSRLLDSALGSNVASHNQASSCADHRTGSRSGPVQRPLELSGTRLHLAIAASPRRRQSRAASSAARWTVSWGLTPSVSGRRSRALRSDHRGPRDGDPVPAAPFRARGAPARLDGRGRRSPR